MNDDVPLKCGGSAMQAAMDISECVGSPAIPAAPIPSLGSVCVFALVFRFLMKLLQVGAHPRQFLTSHAASIAHGPERAKRITNVTCCSVVPGFYLGRMAQSTGPGGQGDARSGSALPMQPGPPSFHRKLSRIKR